MQQLRTTRKPPVHTRCIVRAHARVSCRRAINLSGQDSGILTRHPGPVRIDISHTEVECL